MDSKIIKNNGESNINKATIHNPTLELGERCRCGCVPDMMSLFEMAALRAQKKKIKESSQKKIDNNKK